MTRSYRKTTYSKYDLKVHLIWVTKYRYEVLVDQVRDCAKITYRLGNAKALGIERSKVGETFLIRQTATLEELASAF